MNNNEFTCKIAFSVGLEQALLERANYVGKIGNFIPLYHTPIYKIYVEYQSEFTFFFYLATI